MAAQAFEPRLTAVLSARWPDLVTRILAHDEERGWMLMADAGTPVADQGNAPEIWLAVLPRYAELQRGELAHTGDHLAGGVPDLRVERLEAGYARLLEAELPLTHDEVGQLRRFEHRFGLLCHELDEALPLATIQHDDLHLWNLYTLGSVIRVLDWGDASIGHPFWSLIVTFRFLEQINHLSPDDPWFPRLRDAYLEPWGAGLVSSFDLAYRVGAFAHALASMHQRAALPASARPDFDDDYAIVLRRALARTGS